MVDRAAATPYMPGEVIVAIASGDQSTDFQFFVDSFDWNRALAEQHPTPNKIDSTETMMTVERADGDVSLVHLHLGDNTNVFRAMEQLDDNPDVLWSSPNFYQVGDPTEYTPNDPEYVNQYHHTLIGNDLAWDVTLGDPNIIVGITDDGVEIAHQDLAPNVFINPGEVADDGIDNDGNGFIDDVNGWDFVTGDNDPNPNGAGDAHAWSMFVNVQPVNTEIGVVTDIDTAPNQISEDATIGATVGVTAFAVDPDAGDTVSYSLIGSAGPFVIDASTGVVTAAAALDFETTSNYSIDVRAASTEPGTAIHRLTGSQLLHLPV